MTDPTPPTRRSARDAFPIVSRPTADSPGPQTPPGHAPRLLPVATVLLALLGAGALAAAALTPTDTLAANGPTGAPTPTSTHESPRPVPTLAAPATGGATATTMTAVSELPDPAWVTRVAAAANIPERALAAYAGAALAVAETDPSCGLGWNTLAAIGLVETEHGTMDGATIGANGVASPTIIGVPLNGDGVAEVPDSDDGRLDGDATWDRAVGPMQFLPSTWVAYARDGNGDGIADVNQIDDAALTAALYLCEAGGDLTVAQNWITAIAAYNPDVDYNNRVAEAADHYVTVT